MQPIATEQAQTTLESNHTSGKIQNTIRVQYTLKLKPIVHLRQENTTEVSAQ